MSAQIYRSFKTTNHLSPKWLRMSRDKSRLWDWRCGCICLVMHPDTTPGHLHNKKLRSLLLGPRKLIFVYPEANHIVVDLLAGSSPGNCASPQVFLLWTVCRCAVHARNLSLWRRPAFLSPPSRTPWWRLLQREDLFVGRGVRRGKYSTRRFVK